MTIHTKAPQRTDMEVSKIEKMVEEVARDIESRLVHKLQIETTSTKGQSIDYRKGLRDMRYLVMEFTREIASIPALTALTAAHQAGIDEAVAELKKRDTNHLCQCKRQCFHTHRMIDDTIKALTSNK
jgi:hypothetical protein